MQEIYFWRILHGTRKTWFPYIVFSQASDCFFRKSIILLTQFHQTVHGLQFLIPGGRHMIYIQPVES